MSIWRDSLFFERADQSHAFRALEALAEIARVTTTNLLAFAAGQPLLVETKL